MGWFRQLLSRRRVYDDLSAEIREHLEEKTDELVAGGMSREDATVAARIKTAAPWGWTAVQGLFADIRDGLQTTRRNPGFTAIAILSLNRRQHGAFPSTLTTSATTFVSLLTQFISISSSSLRPVHVLRSGPASTRTSWLSRSFAPRIPF